MLPLALVAAAFVAIMFTTLRRAERSSKHWNSCLWALLAWLGYGIYEAIYIPRWLSTIEGAPIRADLAVIGIALAVLTRRALWPTDEAVAPRGGPSSRLPEACSSHTCSKCGYVGPMKTWLRHYSTPQLITLVLLSLMLLPGIVFIAWAWGKHKCPRCGRVGSHGAA